MAEETVAARRRRRFGPETPLTRRDKAAAGVLGSAGVLGGGTAIFLTDNEVGSATLLVLGGYFLVAVVLGRFPRLNIAGNEIDPSKLQEVEEDADAAKMNSEDVMEGLEEARERLSALEASFAILPEAATAPGPVTDARPGVAPSRDAAEVRLDEQLRRLAQEYNEVRWTMPSGDVRTLRMTGIVDRMIATARETDVPDVEALLASADRGIRLVGVAYLNARPDPAHIGALADAALTPDKPFNEYWALRTLHKLLTDHCDQLDATIRLRLRERLREISPTSDRGRQIHEILTDCP